MLPTLAIAQALGQATVSLPAGQDPAAWSNSLSLVDLAVGDRADAAVQIEAVGDRWRVVLVDGSPDPAARFVEPVTDRSGREALASLLASWLRPVAAPALPLPPLVLPSAPAQVSGGAAAPPGPPATRRGEATEDGAVASAPASGGAAAPAPASGGAAAPAPASGGAAAPPRPPATRGEGAEDGVVAPASGGAVGDGVALPGAAAEAGTAMPPGDAAEDGARSAAGASDGGGAESPEGTGDGAARLPRPIVALPPDPAGSAGSVAPPGAAGSPDGADDDPDSVPSADPQLARGVRPVAWIGERTAWVPGAPAAPPPPAVRGFVTGAPGLRLRPAVRSAPALTAWGGWSCGIGSGWPPASPPRPPPS